MGPLNFMRVKVEEDPQGFLDEMEKIFWVIKATNMEGVKFAGYQLKKVT